MEYSKKRITKNTIVLFLRMFIMFLIALYTSRLSLRVLGENDFGIHNVVAGVVSMLGFLSSSLSQGVQRFVSFYIARNEFNESSKVLSSAIVIMIVLSLFVLLVGEGIGVWFLNSYLNIPIPRLNAANYVFQFSLISLICTLIQTPFVGLIMAHENMNIYAGLSILESLLKCAFVLIMSYISFDHLVMYGFFLMVISLIIASLYIIICKTKFIGSKFIFHRERSCYYSLISFSGWNTVGAISSIMSVSGVNIILNMFFGPVINAARGLAVQVTTQVDHIITNIQTAMNPQIVMLYSSGKIEELKELVHDNFRWNFMLYWVVALPIYFCMDFLLSIWLENVPTYTSVFAKIILVRCLFKCFERPLINLLFAFGQMKYPNIASAIIYATEMIIVFGLFSCGFQPQYAFWIDTIAVVMLIVFDLRFLSIKMNFDIIWFMKRVAAPSCFVAVVSFLFMYYTSLMFYNVIFKFVYVCVVSSIVSSILMYFFILSKNNKQMIKQKLYSMLN